jgi:hypothetical protein
MQIHMNIEKSVREHVLYLLGGGGAHVHLEEAVKDFPEKLRGKKVKGIPHTAWQLLEHIRIAQSDILEFSRDSKHVSPKWPEGYWPETDTPPSRLAWSKSVQEILKDLAAMRALVEAPSTDLFKPLPHGDGQTVLREALLIADHHAYHIGQLVLLRRLLGAWKN